MVMHPGSLELWLMSVELSCCTAEASWLEAGGIVKMLSRHWVCIDCPEPLAPSSADFRSSSSSNARAIDGPWPNCCKIKPGPDVVQLGCTEVLEALDWNDTGDHS